MCASVTQEEVCRWILSGGIFWTGETVCVSVCLCDVGLGCELMRGCFGVFVMSCVVCVSE